MRPNYRTSRKVDPFPTSKKFTGFGVPRVDERASVSGFSLTAPTALGVRGSCHITMMSAPGRGSALLRSKWPWDPRRRSIAELKG